jgi:hypothetical protein
MIWDRGGLLFVSGIRWKKGKMVPAREKIDGRNELQCGDPTGFGSKGVFAKVIFFFQPPPSRPAHLTPAAQQSKRVKVIVFRNMFVMKWNTGAGYIVI